MLVVVGKRGGREREKKVGALFNNHKKSLCFLAHIRISVKLYA